MAQDIGEYPRGVPNVNVRAVSVKCDNPVHRVAIVNRVALARSLKSSEYLKYTQNETQLVHL